MALKKVRAERNLAKDTVAYTYILWNYGNVPSVKPNANLEGTLAVTFYVQYLLALHLHVLCA